MNKGKTIIVWILIIGLLGVIGYCSYQIVDRLNGNNKEVKENKTEEKKDEVQALDINDELVQELYSYADNFGGTALGHMNYDSNNFKKIIYYKSVGYVYENDKTLIKDIPDEIKVDVILKIFSKKNMRFTGDDSKYIDQIVPVATINDYVKKVYGENTTIDYNSIPKFSGNPLIDGMDEKNKNFLIGWPRVGSSFGVPKLYTKLVKAEKVNDDIILYQDICYILGNPDNHNIKVYNNFNKEKLLISWTEEEAAKAYPGANVLDDLSFEFSTYKFTFKKDGNNYYFYSVEKAK